MTFLEKPPLWARPWKGSNDIIISAKMASAFLTSNKETTFLGFFQVYGDLFISLVFTGFRVIFTFCDIKSQYKRLKNFAHTPF